MGLELTAKQSAIFLFIQNYAATHGYPPSIREIGHYFQISPPSVLAHLKALERKEFIRRFPMKPRCLEILKPKDKAA